MAYGDEEDVPHAAPRPEAGIRDTSTPQTRKRAIAGLAVSENIAVG
jgi:hypothetical protein